MCQMLYGYRRIEQANTSGTSHFCKAEIAPFPYMVYENVSILRVTQVYSAINRARKRDVEGAVPYIIM